MSLRICMRVIIIMGMTVCMGGAGRELLAQASTMTRILTHRRRQVLLPAFYIHMFCLHPYLAGCDLESVLTAIHPVSVAVTQNTLEG